MKRKELRSRNLNIRVSMEEYAALQEKFKTTTYRLFSEYIRGLLNQKPPTIFYRNKSLDEFLPVAIALKEELQAIGRDVKQAVKKLNDAASNSELNEALEYFAAEEFSLRQKTEEIKNILIEIHAQCLQKY